MVDTARASRSDALIIGGGLSGATLGTILGRAGRSVTLVERSSGAHHKVCGEFLSPEAVMYLEQLGLRPAVLGAVPIRGVRLASQSLIAESPLPFSAMSLTRQVLDEALLGQAAQAGVRVLRGHRVKSLSRSDAGWTAQLENGSDLCGSAAFLATGKHDLPGRPRPVSKQNDLVAFKMYFRLEASQQAALSQHVELILFPGGYAGLQPVEDGMANLCLLVTRSQLRKCGAHWTTLFQHIQNSSEFLANRLQGAVPLLPKPLALSSIPYGLLRSHAEDGLWQLGDQAAVIPSFSGDGMSIALHSAYLAASFYLRGGTAQSFQLQIYEELRMSVKLASGLSRLMIGAPMLAQITRLWPSLLSRIATGTRVPSNALINRADKPS